MKITFEGKTISEILDQVKSLIALELAAPPVIAPTSEPVPEAIAAVDKPVDKPVDKMAKARAARGKPKAAPAPAPEPEAEPEPFGEVDPAEIVKLRQKTLEELQTAYADGHHKEVLTLLSVHGNGAKSFRELPPEAFIPIREAIDLGALTTKAPT